MATDDDSRKMLIHLTNDDAGTGNSGITSLCLLPIVHLKVFGNFDVEKKLKIVREQPQGTKDSRLSTHSHSRT